MRGSEKVSQFKMKITTSIMNSLLHFVVLFLTSISVNNILKCDQIIDSLNSLKKCLPHAKGCPNDHKMELVRKFSKFEARDESGHFIRTEDSVGRFTLIREVGTDSVFVLT